MNRMNPLKNRHRIRIATIQYFIRPIDSFDEFAGQVRGMVETAAEQGCSLVIFPEYFTIQLMTLGDLTKPVREQVRDLADRVPEFKVLMTGLAKKNNITIVGGTIPSQEEDGTKLFNDCFVFSPSGKVGRQGKLHMTRWEGEDWYVSPRRGVQVFNCSWGRFAVAICYDSEFPEIARAAAREGCYLLVVPSCTEDRQGFFRVRYCSQARAIENTMYVAHACTVGSLPMIPTVSMNYGWASILTPSDYPFARDGILSEGQACLEQVVIGELDLDTIEETREHGTVLPLRDSITTAQVTDRLDVVDL